MSHPPRFSLFGTLVLAAAIFCWSLIPPMLKVFTGSLDSWTMNGIRYPFAALLFVVPLIIQYRRGSIDRRIWTLALIPTAFNIVAQVSWAAIPYYLDATRMGFFVRISVVFSILGGFICFPEERSLIRSPLFWTGVLCSFAGVAIMSFGGETLPERGSMVGILLALGCGASYGLYAVAARFSLRGARPWVAFPVISLYTSVALIGLMFHQGEPKRMLELTPSSWGLLLLSATIGVAAAHTLYYMAIERLGVAISSSVQLVAPFLTSYWSYLSLGETITLTQWGGGVVLFCGGILLILSQTKFAPLSLDADKAPVEPDAPD